MSKLATIEGTAIAVPSGSFNADAAIAVYDELQRFIAHILGDRTKWPRDKSGKPMPPAVALNKLWSPLGCSDEFLTRDEDGLPGVSRHELPDGHEIYKCVLRVTSSRLGSSYTRSAELRSTEHKKLGVERSYLASQCETRARNKCLSALAGLDTEEPPKPSQGVDMRTLMDECVRRSLCPDDKLAFLDFCRQSVKGCADMGPTPKMSHVAALHKYLQEHKA